MINVKEPITIKEIRRHIKNCLRYKKRYDWLGLVENKELTPEVEALFAHPRIPHMWDWVNGNSRLQKIIKEKEINWDYH